MANEEKYMLVDIEDAVRKSKNKFVRNLPQPLVNLIRKTIKQDELNAIHYKYKDLWGIDYVKALLFEEFKVKLNFIGTEKINPDKRYVYVGNHPLGAIDALSHLLLVYQIHGNVVSPSNELFEYIPNLSPLILGVNVFGQNSKQKAEELNNLFMSDKQVMMFPAGEVSRFLKWKVQDPPWKKTFVTKAVQSKRDIVPVFFDAHNSFWFYFWAKLRQLSGLKMYVETMLLPREMLKQYGMELNVYVLDTVSWQEIKDSKKSHQWWADEIRRRVHEMKKKIK